MPEPDDSLGSSSAGCDAWTSLWILSMLAERAMPGAVPERPRAFLPLQYSERAWYVSGDGSSGSRGRGPSRRHSPRSTVGGGGVPTSAPGRKCSLFQSGKDFYLKSEINPSEIDFSGSREK